MKNRVLVLILATAGLASVGLGSVGMAQASPLPLPPGVEKELAARASNVTEVTLGKNMLTFASKFMNGKDDDDVATRKLIDGLDGIYVRDYEFDNCASPSRPASGRRLCMNANARAAKPPT